MKGVALIVFYNCGEVIECLIMLIDSFVKKGEVIDEFCFRNGNNAVELQLLGKSFRGRHTILMTIIMLC